MEEKSPLLPASLEPVVEVREEDIIREAQQRARKASPPRSPRPALSATQQQQVGSPNFISAVLPLFGIISGSVLTAYIMGRWYFSIMWMAFIMYGVWEILRRRVERFEAYHRNRIDREISKEKLEYHMETCEWINHIVDRFWTVLEPVVSSQVIDKANQELARQCPGFLDSIELTEFTLGSSAPHILGARVYPQTGSDTIHLDLDLCFVPNEVIEHDFIPKTNPELLYWNSKVVLKARVGKGILGIDIPVMLKEILFYGRLRVQVQLAANIPFVQKVEIGFLEQPKIDFILKPLKSVDIMDLPGLSRFLFSMINNNVAAQLVSPNKLTIDVSELMKSKKKTRMNSIGVVRVFLYQTRGLKESENATVKVSLAGRLKVASSKLEKGEDSWNEVFYVLIPSLSYPITFSIISSSSGIISGSSDLLGTCKVSMEEVAGAEDKDLYTSIWKTMTTRGSGKAPELNLGVQYYAAEYIDNDEADADKMSTQEGKQKKDVPKYKSGILQITLHGAKDLPVHPSKKDWTTFMEVSIENYLADDIQKRHTEDDLNPYKFRSTTKKKSNAPSWEETFEFLVVDYEHDSIKFILRDAKDDYRLGDMELAAIDLLDTSDWFSLKNVDSGKVYLSTVFKPVNIDIDDPSKLKYAPSLSVLNVEVHEGLDFQQHNELTGKQEYYVGLSVNGRVVKQTKVCKTTGNPLWNEKLTAFIKAETDQVSIGLFEENNLRRDTAMGIIKIPIKDLMKEQKPLNILDKLKDEKGEDENERLKLTVTNYLIDEQSEPNSDKTMVTATNVPASISNSGILELRSLQVNGLSCKKIYCEISLSTEPEEIIETKEIRSMANGQFTFDIFQELFAVDYKKTALWLVFKEDSKMVSSGSAYSISIPLNVLQSGKIYELPDNNNITVQVIGQFRPIRAVLQQPTENKGLLKVSLDKASVIAVDSNGASDPFVTVKLNGKTAYKTKVIKNTIRPEWKELCEVPIEDRQSTLISFEVSDWNQVMMSKSLGHCEVNLSELEPDKLSNLELKLENVSSGTLSVTLFYETEAGKSAKGLIASVPFVIESKSGGIVGVVGAPVTLAADLTKGAAGVAGSMVGHTADATKMVTKGAVGAVGATGSAIKSGVTSVFGFATGSSRRKEMETDLKFTIKQMTSAKEIGKFNCQLLVFIDGKQQIYKSKTIKHNDHPDWEETFEVSAKQLKGARAIEFHPQSSLNLDQLGLSADDKPVFCLDLSRPELTSDEGASIALFLNDREDDPPLTLNVSVQTAAAAKAEKKSGFGKILKFGKSSS